MISKNLQKHQEEVKDYSIAFLDWLSENCDVFYTGQWHYRGEYYTSEGIYQIYRHDVLRINKNQS
jgi:hypothetical protein